MIFENEYTCNEYEYNYAGKRKRNGEKKEDMLICVHDDSVLKIRKGHEYKIWEAEEDWVKLNGNNTCYMWNRFLPIIKYRELQINELLKDE